MIHLVIPDGTFEEIEKCPYCGSTRIKYIEAYPHLRAECIDCERFIKFVQHYNDKTWARKVKERANYKCEMCGKDVYGRQAHAHHKVPQFLKPEWKYRIDNGMCVCTECHNKIHGYGGTIRESED